jgi:hypothetical protein
VLRCPRPSQGIGIEFLEMTTFLLPSLTRRRAARGWPVGFTCSIQVRGLKPVWVIRKTRSTGCSQRSGQPERPRPVRGRTPSVTGRCAELRPPACSRPRARGRIRVAVELLPKALVVGVLVAVAPSAANLDAINRIWMQLSRRMGYRQLVQGGEGGATFVTSGDDALVIQPPLLQFRSPATLGFANAAEDAQVCLKTAAEQLGAKQFANLGMKHVVHATAPNNDARAFVQNQLLRGADEALGMLDRGGSGWVGVKYGIEAADGTMSTLVIEPFIADSKFLFVDLDTQHPGQIELDRIPDRAKDAERYLTDTVRPYLEGTAGSA